MDLNIKITEEKSQKKYEKFSFSVLIKRAY